MNQPMRHADAFIVINGPEDGAEFPVARAPLEIGSDAACAVRLGLDDAIAPRHARATVEATGYRVRAAGPAPVYVDGKRAGLVRSRIAGNGSFIQVGNTTLAVACACDGLASRSRGLAPAGDFVWALRLILRHGWSAGRRTMRYATYGVHRILSRWFTVLAILAVLWFFVPGFRRWAWGVWRWLDYYVVGPVIGALS